MFLEEFLHEFARMISRSILDQDQMLFGFPDDGLEKLGVGFRLQSFFLGSIEKASGEIINQPKDFIAFSDAGCLDGGLLAPFGPGIRQSAPLRKGGFIAKEDGRRLLLGLFNNLGPGFLQSLHALLGIFVVGNKSSLLV